MYARLKDVFATRAQMEIHGFIRQSCLAVDAGHAGNPQARLFLKLNRPLLMPESDCLLAVEKLVIEIGCQLKDVMGDLCAGPW